MADDHRTHSMGVLCAECEAVLVPDDCSCGGHHGFTFQWVSAWAGRTWPGHKCFQEGGAT